MKRRSCRRRGERERTRGNSGGDKGRGTERRRRREKRRRGGSFSGGE